MPIKKGSSFAGIVVGSILSTLTGTERHVKRVYYWLDNVILQKQ